MPALYLAGAVRRFLLIAVFVAFFSAESAIAQKSPTNAPSPPKYDVQAETKMKGTVEELKLPPKGSQKEVAHMLLKNGTENIDVYLCPGSFLEDMGVTFKKGDEIALTGSKIKQGDIDLILAREVVRGTDTLVLRDEKGSPVWSWHH